MASACVGLASPVTGQGHSCGPWASPASGMKPIDEAGLKRTARMARGTLRQRVFLDEDSVLNVYGDPVPGNGRPPAFGDGVTLQRLHLNEAAPILVQTACERLK